MSIDSELLMRFITMQETVHNLVLRVDELERQLADRDNPNMPTPVRRLDETQAKDLYWVCTPVQHAMIQLIFEGFTNQKLASRLNSNENSIKARFRHLCSRLAIKNRAELEANYRNLFELSSEEYYLRLAHIPKNWAVKYGELTFSQASKEDPYYGVICETRYRGVTLT